MQKKHKTKANNSIINRLLSKQCEYHIPLSVEAVMERLHHMPDKHEQLGFIKSFMIVENEDIADGYLLEIEVLDNPDTPAVAYFKGTVRDNYDDGTVLSGYISSNVHLLGIVSACFVMVVLFIVWFGDSVALSIFILVILSGLPILLLLNIIMKRRLLVRELEAIVSASHDLPKTKQKPKVAN